MGRRPYLQLRLALNPGAGPPRRRGLRFCSLASSSTYGNAYLVAEPGGAALLVDCGAPLRRIQAGLKERGVEPGRVVAVLLTHRHGDHTRALCIKIPLPQRLGVPVYAPAGVWEEAEGEFGAMPPALRRRIAPGRPVRAGPFVVRAFAKPHDARDPVGFLVEAAGERLAVATDLGRVDSGLTSLLRGCHHLIFESNHDPELEWASGRPRHLIQRILGDLGHLSNDQAGSALAAIVTRRTRTVLLAHLSIDCNRPDLALDTVSRYLRPAGYRGILAAAPPRGPSPWYPE
ncbi:MAG: MBL fold metallo-hydrolase [Acetobacteraceae bacterium]|nr:MBL fold metallo-hydrolase [Acetobacteraceae bacterium]